MQEYDGPIDLFRVRKRLYFLDDMEYLGWKPFAKKGIRVHGISGDHRSFLMAPYDREFAQALQAQLDACAKC
jgi:thioesterase domain-containing protein